MYKYLAECLGTFVLVFSGVGTAVVGGNTIGDLAIALAFGFSLLAMVYTIGPISNCHINPAVTLGNYLAKRIGAREAVCYVIAQIGGGIFAAGLILAIAHGAPAGYSAAASGLGANGYGAHSPGHYSMESAFLLETILTFLFVITVLGTTDSKAPAGFAGLAIGLALTLVHLIGLPVTNTSVNPARSIGPALFVGGWALKQLWLFLLAPCIGAAIAAFCYRALWSQAAPLPAPPRPTPPSEIGARKGSSKRR